MFYIDACLTLGVIFKTFLTVLINNKFCFCKLLNHPVFWFLIYQTILFQCTYFFQRLRLISFLTFSFGQTHQIRTLFTRYCFDNMAKYIFLTRGDKHRSVILYIYKLPYSFLEVTRVAWAAFVGLSYVLISVMYLNNYLDKIVNQINVL